MDRINIEGLILSNLKIIKHPKGNIYHGIKRDDLGFVDFGEAYFSTILGGHIKGWNRHKKMTLNLIVPVGDVTFVVYDDRKDSKTNSVINTIQLSSINYSRLTIPPGLWVAFKGSDSEINLILNIASIAHDPKEIDRLQLDQIDFDWKSV